MAINTVKSINEGNGEQETIIRRGKKSQVQISKELKDGIKQAVEEEMVEVTIPVALSGRMGNPYGFGVNGITVLIPIDGKPHKIPKAHAKRLAEIMANIR